MGKICLSRAIAGGLLAGLVINVIEFLVNSLWLAKEWEAVMTAMGKPPGNSPAQIVVFSLWGFVMGIVLVWLYAAIRPRFGAGPRTALTASLAVWILGYLLSMVPPLVLEIFPVRLGLISMAVGLVEIVVAGNLGARVYRENSGSAATAA
jgi:hypothetical protein